MKKVFFPLFFVGLFFAMCKETPDLICPTVDSELVPVIVKDSLFSHYSGVVVDVWYKIDDVGFCAKFSQSPNVVFAHLGIDGTFKEAEIKDLNGKEIDSDNTQDEHDNTENTCECQ